MKNIVIISVFIAIITRLYGFYFFNLEKFLDEPTEPYHLVSPSLSRNVAYFQLNEGDTTISTYKCVGEFKNDYVIMYQWQIEITKGSNFKNTVNEYTKSKMFLFDYTHPINEKELKFVSQSNLRDLISERRIICLDNKDVRNSMVNGENKMFLFYLYPFGTFVLILLYSFLIRGIHFIGNKMKSPLLGLVLKISIILVGIALVNYCYFTLNGLESISFITYLSFPIIFIMDYLTKRTKIRWDFGISEVSKVVVTLLTCGLIIASIAFFEMYYYSITNEGEEVTKAIYEGFDKAIFATAIFLLTCMPFIIANFINNCINYIQEKKRTIDLLAYEKKDTEYKAIELDNLMARMNPHFLFNGLNSIASLASIDTDKTEKMAISLADFYKYASNRENKFISTIKEELELLDSYIAVEQIRYGNKLSVSKTIGESVMDYKIPFMILQPLVENAVKYGYSAGPDQICIDIQVYKSDEYINILIFDKGKPFSDEMQTGFGLHSISRKLTIIYGDRFELKMINEPFKHVFLRIPNSVSL